MSTVNNLLHIVINTHCRRMTIPEDHKRELYKYLYGIITKRNCKLLRMNGIGNHIHLLVDLNPTISLSEFTQALKQGSSRWLKENPAFPHFEGWGKEYFAFSISKSIQDSVIDYIINQESHHLHKAFEEELKSLTNGEGITWDDKLLT